VLFVAKVVLGNVYNASQFKEVEAPPPGFNSVSIRLFYVSESLGLSLARNMRLSSTGARAG
jgi:hypothetical protein